MEIKYQSNTSPSILNTIKLEEQLVDISLFRHQLMVGLPTELIQTTTDETLETTTIRLLNSCWLVVAVAEEQSEVAEELEEWFLLLEYR